MSKNEFCIFFMYVFFISTQKNVLSKIFSELISKKNEIEQS